MDLDAEMEKLRREARAKLDAERAEAAPPAEDEAPAPAPELDAEALAAARKLAKNPAGDMSLGGKIATVILGLVAAYFAFVFILAPLLKIAVIVGIIAAVVWVIIKLMDDDDDDQAPDAPKKPG